MCERVREKLSKPAHLTRNSPNHISWFRPSKVSIGSPWDASHTPTIIVAETRRDHRCFKLEKPRPKPIITTVDSTEIWPHHHLSFVPHDSLFNFWPSTATESRRFVMVQLLEFHGYQARFQRRCRMWELTAGTFRPNVIGTFRSWAFLPALTKFWWPLTGEGNSVILHFEGDFVISEPMDILVIPEIEDWV